MDWGKHLWKSIHYIALGYDPQFREDYKYFYLNLYKILPCKKCSKHYKEHLITLPSIDKYLDNNENLFEWTVILHNKVNKSLGKRVLSLNQAKRVYTYDKMYKWQWIIGVTIIILILFWFFRKNLKI